MWTYWKLSIKTPRWYQWRSSGVFFVNFEQISDIVLVFPLVTLNKWMAAIDNNEVSKISTEGGSTLLVYYDL